jgi:hypothetical protein
MCLPGRIHYTQANISTLPPSFSLQKKAVVKDVSVFLSKYDSNSCHVLLLLLCLSSALESMTSSI